jgi:pilus assembly protein CpaB
MEVSPTKRALSIPIDDMRGVSRLLRPGDRIDLIAAIDYGKGADQKKEVRTVLQDAPVLATGLNVANKIPVRFEKDSNGAISRINLSGNTNFNNITIEVKPEEAQQIIYILATSPGSLFVTLRHPNDRYVNPTRTTQVEDVLGRPNLRLPSNVPIVVAPPPVVAPRVMPKKRNGRFEEL